MCLLGKLPLTFCSDNFDFFSLSPFRRVVNRKEGNQDKNTTKTYWVSKNESRQREPDMSLHYSEMDLNKMEGCKKSCTTLQYNLFYTFLCISTFRYLFLLSIISEQAMLKIKSIVQQTREIIL
jgi:hypothetical protein